jgi:subtilisin family serine protease
VASAVACAARPPPEPAPPRVCLADAELERFVVRSQARVREQFMNKLDPRLRIRVNEVAAAAARRSLVPSSSSSAMATGSATNTADDACIDPVIDILVAFTGPLEDLQAVGYENIARGRGPAPNGWWIASGRIAPSRLVELAAIPHVVSVEGSNPMTPELDDSLPEARVKQLRDAFPHATGDGVVVAIIDSGFDWRHGSFRGPDGRTRILAIWDMYAKLPRKPGERGYRIRDPNGTLGPELGVYYTKDDIDFSLGFPTPDPAPTPAPVKVRTEDPPKPYDPKNPDEKYGHGTHVGGIAAGDGSPEPCCRPSGAGKYSGVAPRASLIIVRSGYDNTQLRWALAFIDDIAGSHPVVVNLSGGTNRGAHDREKRRSTSRYRMTSPAPRISTSGGTAPAAWMSRLSSPITIAAQPGSSRAREPRRSMSIQARPPRRCRSRGP